MKEFISAIRTQPILFKLNSLICLARPSICMLGFAGVYLGYWVGIDAIDILNLKCLIGAIAATLAMAYGNTINDVLDHKIDTIVFPNRPIPAGKVTPQDGLLSGGIIVGLTLLLGAAIGKDVLILIFIGLLLVTVYNLWGKNLQIMGNLLIAVVSLIPGLLGNLIANEGLLPASLMIALMIYVLAREIFRTIHDGPGDLIAGRRSIFLTFGREKTQIIAFILGFVGTIIFLLYPLNGQVRYPFIYGANIILILVLLCFTGFFSQHYLNKESTQPYYDAVLTLLMRSIFCLGCISFIWII